MLTQRDHNARYKALETLRKTRIRNLRRLREQYNHSWAELARALGQSSSFLIAIAGPNPRRNIGEKLARDLEGKLGLKSGWLDTTH
jgi:hypothetical protein